MHDSNRACTWIDSPGILISLYQSITRPGVSSNIVNDLLCGPGQVPAFSKLMETLELFLKSWKSSRRIWLLKVRLYILCLRWKELPHHLMMLWAFQFWSNVLIGSYMWIWCAKQEKIKWILMKTKFDMEICDDGKSRDRLPKHCLGATILHF